MQEDYHYASYSTCYTIYSIHFTVYIVVCTVDSRLDSETSIYQVQIIPTVLTF